MIGMKVQCRGGQREERTQLLERNGAKMEIIYCKHKEIKLGMFFIFCTTDGWWGLIVALILAVRINNSPIRCLYFPLSRQGLSLRAAERGKSVDFVRLLYIMGL